MGTFPRQHWRDFPGIDVDGDIFDRLSQGNNMNGKGQTNASKIYAEARGSGAGPSIKVCLFFCVVVTSGCTAMLPTDVVGRGLVLCVCETRE